MTTIHLETSALGIPTSGVDGPGLHVQPNLERMVGHLLDAGHEVRLLGHGEALTAVQEALGPALADRLAVEEIEPDALAPEAEGLVVTGSEDVCEQLRSRRRLRTVLVGATTGAADQVDRPADVLARSLTDAVLGILTEDAMAPTGGSDGEPGDGPQRA